MNEIKDIEKLKQHFDKASKDWAIKQSKNPSNHLKRAKETGLIDNDIGSIKDKNGRVIPFNVAEFLMKINHILTINEVVYIYDDGIYTQGEKVLKKQIQELLGEDCTTLRTTEILNHIKRTTYILNDFKEDENLICLKNGVLDLRTTEIKKHSPDYILFNKVPVEYIPGAACPGIIRFLKEVLLEEDINITQEIFGYCLYKKHFIHKAMMLVGYGRNGKSTFINLIKAFLGHANCSSVPLQTLEKERFAVANLFGKLANLSADLSPTAMSSTSTFKMLTGQDLIYAEKKFKESFSFENYAKLIFSANQVPQTYDDTDAYFGRWIILTFPNRFTDEDGNLNPNLLDELTTPGELRGLFNFALEGLKRLLKNKQFSFSKTTDRVREEYTRMSDPVAAFVMDKILIDPESHIIKKELYQLYITYCKEKKYPIWSENTFHKNLLRHVQVSDFRPKNMDNSRARAWKGIKFNYENEEKCPPCPQQKELIT